MYRPLNMCKSNHGCWGCLAWSSTFLMIFQLGFFSLKWWLQLKTSRPFLAHSQQPTFLCRFPWTAQVGIPSGKRLQKTMEKSTMLLMRKQTLFRLGHFPVRFLYVYQAGYFGVVSAMLTWWHREVATCRHKPGFPTLQFLQPSMSNWKKLFCGVLQEGTLPEKAMGIWWDTSSTIS